MNLSRARTCTFLWLLGWLLVSAMADAQPTSRVFPSARWAWYIVSDGVAWPAGGMTQDDVTRWIAAHADLLVAGEVNSVHEQANPNLIGTWYQEWFYANLLVSSGDTKQIQRWSDGRPMDGELVYVENYYLSRNLDPETPFYHLVADYWWETTFKLYEDEIGLSIRSQSPTLNDYAFRLYTCEPYTDGTNGQKFQIPPVAGGTYAFGRPEPYDELYLEWLEPPNGGEFVLEYVSEVTTDSSGFTVPSAWTPVQIISDGTNGFRQDGVIRFRMPDRWTQWKRAVLYSSYTWSRKHYWIRIRVVTPPSNTPKIRGAWLSPIYRTYPYVKNSGEAIYLGFRQPQASVTINLRSAGSGGAYVFEYATAKDSSNKITGWTALPSVSDGTNGLQQSGTISWSLPGDWVEGRANIGKAPMRYWIRIRVTSAPTTAAVVESASAGGRLLYNQEIYASRYQMKVPGWDARNDRNGDGWVDDDEFANLVNPNATARYRWHSRVIRSGWEGALNYVWNFGVPELKQILRDCFYESGLGDPNKTKLWGFYSDSMVVSSPSPVLSNGQVAESGKEQWEQRWLEAHAYIRSNNPVRVVGGNVSFTEPYAPAQWHQRLLDPNDWYEKPYNDFIMYEGYPHGWGTTTDASFRRRLLNIARTSADGVYHILQFNMMWNCLQRIGGGSDATAWRRFQEHSLAFFYLVQHPVYSFMSLWNGVYYGCSVQTFPIGTMPNVMAYQPTAMLEVDIGQPANSIPQGYSPITLTYRNGGDLPDNIVVGDTATPVLNNNFAPFAGKPVYPTYVFALASGTIPGRSTTYTVFARKYTKGLVLLKMTSNYESADVGDTSATTHTLPGVYRRVNWDGTLSEPITQITLKGMEGAVLVDAAVTSQPSVQLAMSVDKQNPKPLDVVTVTITATNTGNAEARNVEIRVPLSNSTYEQGSVSPSGLEVDSSNPSELKIRLPSLAAGGNTTIRFRMVIR